MIADSGIGAILPQLLAGRIDADQALDEMVARLHSTDEPDFDLIARIGAGPLVSIFHHGAAGDLWPRIEDLARKDVRFRRALAATWAYHSPLSDRVESLLAELGENKYVELRFAIEPRTFDFADGFGWRAVEIDKSLPRERLAEVLREIAAWLELPQEDTPESYSPQRPDQTTRLTRD